MVRGAHGPQPLAARHWTTVVLERAVHDKEPGFGQALLELNGAQDECSEPAATDRLHWVRALVQLRS